MTVDRAEQLVRAHWTWLETLWGQFADVQTIALRAAAAEGRLHRKIQAELQFGQWQELYERLRRHPHAARCRASSKETPLLGRLWEVIDRRREFGIPEVKAPLRASYGTRTGQRSARGRIG